MSCCEEPSEETAMTSPGETTALEDGGDLDTTARGHRKAFYKRFFRSPAGKCVLFVAVVTCLALLAYLMAKLVIGIIHINSCPVDSLVPLYLIASPALLILALIIIAVVAFKCRRDDDDEERVSSHHLIALVYFFLHLVLQLAGSVCVIRARSDVEDLRESSQDQEGAPTQELLCDEGLLNFAFGVVVFELILSGIVLLGVFIVLGEVIYLVCCQPEPNKQHTAHQQGASGGR